jgi:hypothetical protein
VISFDALLSLVQVWLTNYKHGTFSLPYQVDVGCRDRAISRDFVEVCDPSYHRTAVNSALLLRTTIASLAFAQLRLLLLGWIWKRSVLLTLSWST